ncbi:uncharacterized protein KNAG_0L01710 [Huiozyma naganishii CBS 8797]|uniref:Uncharacterized protein n=1 Tax=Huiozyma naganishii (strain ATCC MYA-139 / BCRC 22969 / CBS 8797 / KCTC 17520 / NBRC 10181 / NCYC 3082 / Yp74L-3) TaxID=1071383 RepID=J7SB67_HUIN7|nr:hypothetical protein KNAG_0L01710 [Kazachstania naganishii CBS 8797]CCK72791.1 hypothetical protein KNAG_0L01710 [Kazachstania naganishii CBS 8797]
MLNDIRAESLQEKRNFETAQARYRDDPNMMGESIFKQLKHETQNSLGPQSGEFCTTSIEIRKNLTDTVFYPDDPKLGNCTNKIVHYSIVVTDDMRIFFSSAEGLDQKLRCIQGMLLAKRVRFKDWGGFSSACCMGDASRVCFCSKGRLLSLSEAIYKIFRFVRFDHIKSNTMRQLCRMRPKNGGNIVDYTEEVINISLNIRGKSTFTQIRMTRQSWQKNYQMPDH